MYLLHSEIFVEIRHVAKLIRARFAKRHYASILNSDVPSKIEALIINYNSFHETCSKKGNNLITKKCCLIMIFFSARIQCIRISPEPGAHTGFLATYISRF